MKTILVIDNAYSTLLMLKDEFRNAGYKVLTTASGDEALQILKDPSKDVNLVITNLRHAGPHGLEFMWLIKSAWPDLPVICFTALSEYQKLLPQDRPFNVLVEKSFSDLTGLKSNVNRLIGEAD
jgi:CheY-like chemotaxis protein